MSENKLLLRERLNATSGPMSKGENAKTDHVLRDDELDAVSGGKVQMQDVHFVRFSSFSWGMSDPGTVSGAVLSS